MFVLHQLFIVGCGFKDRIALPKVIRTSVYTYCVFIYEAKVATY